MIDTRTAETVDDATQGQTPAQAPAKGRFDPELGVYFFPESELRAGVMVGVALLGPNGRRLPPRRPIAICDPARKPPRRRRGRRPPDALTIAGWLLLVIAGVTLCAGAASCLGSF
jgi:hypothetical protein